MKFFVLSSYLEKLESISSRNEITSILAELFSKVESKEIRYVVYLLLGALAPRFEGIVFNLAERKLLEVVSHAYTVPLDDVKLQYKKTGDIGNVAQSLSQKTQSTISVLEVYETLKKLAVDAGSGSQERKVHTMSKLLTRLDPVSARYVVRIPLGKLRLGFSDKTILDALSVFSKGDKSGKKALEGAYQVLPDVGLLAEAVKEKGLENATKHITPKIGVPVLPMLAQRLKSPAEMIKKMGTVAVEPKLDGLRVQIHFNRGEKVRAFTRNLNDISWMFPELEDMGKYVAPEKVILDVEAMGINENTKKLANFQTTMTRRRKHNIAETSKKVGITFYVFDILLKDNKNLLLVNYPERRIELEKIFTSDGLFRLVEYTVTSDSEIISNLHKTYIEKGYEGVLVKRLDSGYVPGRTGWRWVKMKEAEASTGKLSDTVDVVVMGYYVGRGKRNDFGIGGFLAGVREGGDIKTITKVGTGLTDLQFRELKTRLDAIEVEKQPKEYVVHKNLFPDVWVLPEVVVELAADDMTVSPTHTAGYAMRFPRLVKFRDDKSQDEITTVDEIKKLYKLQVN